MNLLSIKLILKDKIKYKLRKILSNHSKKIKSISKFKIKEECGKLKSNSKPSTQA